MQLSLEEIQFNHGTVQGTGAFHLRRNEALWVTLPEWRRRDDCGNPSCSPVAYAKSYLPAELTIKASFSCDDMAVASVKVRAWGCEIFEVKPEVSAAHVLGHIAEHDIPLKNGQSGQLPLKLTDNIRNVGIGIHDITWRWQFSLDSVNWTDFQTTRHRIYIVLAIPQEPWEPECSGRANIHIPWTDVLDYACSWAVGVKGDLDEAATRVTHSVYDLGKIVSYSFGPSYAHDKFNCTQFLRLLKTGIGGYQALNCDDCATIVSTYANILGCNLSQSGMGLGFGSNPILVIGDSVWQPKHFTHHCVAWKGNGLKGDILFDGCLRVDGDKQPGVPPHEALQPVNVQFGDGTDDQYKFRLAKSGTCVPIPTDGRYGLRRRKFGSGYLADRQITDTEFLDRLKELYAFDRWPAVPAFEHKSERDLDSKGRLLKLEITFPNWQLYEYQRLKTEKFTNILLAIFRRADTDELLAINLYESGDAGDANNFMLEVLGSIERLMDRLENPSVGELAFEGSDGSAVLFRRHRFVAVVRSAGKQPISVMEFARVIDAYLLPQLAR